MEPEEVLATFPGSVTGVEGFCLPAGDELKQRKPNFTEAEKFFLVRQYDEYKGILATKGGDSNVYRTKHQVWHMITDELNRRNPAVQRTVGEIRKKWQNLVTTARKELRDAEQRGLASSQLPFLWRKVAELCEDDMSFGTEESTMDKSPSISPYLSVSQDNCGESRDHQSPSLIKNEPEWRNDGESPCPGGVSTTTTAPHTFQTLNNMGSGEVQSQSISHHITSPPQAPGINSTFNIALSSSSAHSFPSVRDDKFLYSRPPSSKRRFPEKNGDATPGTSSSYYVQKPEEKDERWSLEKSSRLQAMRYAEEKHELEQKKLRLEIQILDLQRQKLELEVHHLRQTRASTEN